MLNIIRKFANSPIRQLAAVLFFAAWGEVHAWEITNTIYVVSNVYVREVHEITNKVKSTHTNYYFTNNVTTIENHYDVTYRTNATYNVDIGDNYLEQMRERLDEAAGLRDSSAGYAREAANSATSADHWSESAKSNADIAHRWYTRLTDAYAGYMAGIQEKVDYFNANAGKAITNVNITVYQTEDEVARNGVATNVANIASNSNRLNAVERDVADLKANPVLADRIIKFKHVDIYHYSIDSSCTSFTPASTVALALFAIDPSKAVESAERFDYVLDELRMGMGCKAMKVYKDRSTGTTYFTITDAANAQKTWSLPGGTGVGDLPETQSTYLSVSHSCLLGTESRSAFVQLRRKENREDGVDWYIASDFGVYDSSDTKIDTMVRLSDISPKLALVDYVRDRLEAATNAIAALDRRLKALESAVPKTYTYTFKRKVATSTTSTIGTVTIDTSTSTADTSITLDDYPGAVAYRYDFTTSFNNTGTPSSTSPKIALVAKFLPPTGATYKPFFVVRIKTSSTANVDIVVNDLDEYLNNLPESNASNSYSMNGIPYYMMLDFVSVE